MPSASLPRYRAANRSRAWRSTWAPVVSRIAAYGGPAGRARKASRAGRHAPTVKFVPNPLLLEQRGETPGARQRPGGVLPLALAADQQQAELVAQPAEVIAGQVGHVVQRVVEVRFVTPLAPA